MSKRLCPIKKRGKSKAQTERWLQAAAAAVRCLRFMLNIVRNLQKRVER